MDIVVVMDMHLFQPRELPGHFISKDSAWAILASELHREVLWESCRKSSVQFSSVVQLCPTLCDPMNHSTPGLPVHNQLPESNQTHIHQVGDAIQPSHPLLSPSPPALKLSQHQALFK